MDTPLLIARLRIPLALLALGLGFVSPLALAEPPVVKRNATAEAPFSSSIWVGDTLYLSGQLGASANAKPETAELEAKAVLDNVKNVLKVDLDPAHAALWVNGTKVLSVPRAEVSTDGRVGFRVGKDMNLHITTLNVTRKLAPVPVKKG